MVDERKTLLPLAVCLLVITTTARALHIDTTHVVKQGGGSSNELRCFCNLPECIVTGYMCKSQGMGCFSDVVEYSDAYRGQHGCLELLDRERQDHCYNRTSVSKLKTTLLCCYEDVCNHVDSPEFIRRLNQTFCLIVPADSTRLYFNTGRSTGASNSEVWFKAATIAVPICGGLILLVLVVLAVKILRKEQDTLSQRRGVYPTVVSRKQCQHFERNVDGFCKKMPLLLQYHNEALPSGNIVDSSSKARVEKNETNAKLNCTVGSASSGGYSALVSKQQKPSNLMQDHPVPIDNKVCKKQQPSWPASCV